jgi:hypothetical protein
LLDLLVLLFFAHLFPHAGFTRRIRLCVISEFSSLSVLGCLLSTEFVARVADPVL